MKRYYRIRYGDTLERIALTLLGNAERWPELAELNALRYPFISDDLLIQFGNELARVHGTHYTSVGSMGITVDAVGYEDVLLAGNEAVIMAASTPAQGPWTHAPIAAWNPATSTIYLSRPLEIDFVAGATVAIFQNQLELRTRVLRPGDLLAIPTDAPESSMLIQLGASGTKDLWGTDLLCDTSFTAGVRVTVSGIENLVQATKMRLAALQGDLVNHPNYGKPLDLAGISEPQRNKALIAATLRATILQDSRYSDCRNIKVSVAGDKVYFEADAILAGTDDVLHVQNVINL